ncbi:putative membrane protein [Shigella flexneri K-227]|uniref:Putative membrane protein n=1 Tax=Shigella flexneri K-227 TaxID=766147 RepID=F5NW63_SHIFL|nr:putative membrane protein [Shigella flexneri K-218]EGK36316.1 putative membrane protein [Shigella flexneri K-304]EGK37016.1 putative membrane protein [Shigella flexneri K-227]EIQ03943.1 putative membrane protein [Shigella flexneri K-1770]EIQ31452.1 putative membrane protein [Shigella flexneri K-404]
MINDIRICTKINSVMFCIQGVFFLMVRDFNAKKHKVMISYFFISSAYVFRFVHIPSD